MRVGGRIGGAGASTGVVCGWAVVSAGTGEADEVIPARCSESSD